jgi:hypothetical protein
MPNPVVTVLLGRLRNLRFPILAILVGALFLASLVIPDPIPLVDELLLGLVTLLLANWKRRRSPAGDPLP